MLVYHCRQLLCFKNVATKRASAPLTFHIDLGELSGERRQNILIIFTLFSRWYVCGPVFEAVISKTIKTRNYCAFSFIDRFLSSRATHVFVKVRRAVRQGHDNRLTKIACYHCFVCVVCERWQNLLRTSFDFFNKTSNTPVLRCMRSDAIV